VNKELKKTYQECRENQSCYIVGENASGALKQARLVEVAREIGLEVKFEHEDGYWLDYVGDVEPMKRWEKRFQDGTHEVLFAYVKCDGDEILASLGGIVIRCDQSGQDYLHAIELELLAEAAQTLKQGV
jgi:hypothetical protein